MAPVTFDHEPAHSGVTTAHVSTDTRDDAVLLRRLRAATGANAECRVTSPGHWEEGSPGWRVEVSAAPDVVTLVLERWWRDSAEEWQTWSMQASTAPVPATAPPARHVLVRTREQLHLVLDAAERLGFTYTVGHYRWNTFESGYVVRVALTGNDPPSEEWVRTGRVALEGEG